jgi:autoinducer 2-degrading protein
MRIFRTQSSAAGYAEGETVTRRGAMVRMLAWAATLPLLSGVNAERAEAQSAPAGHAVVNLVTFTVPAEGMDRFLAICKTNSDASRKEAGVTGFDVLVARDTPNTVLLVESYRDEAAYKAHRVTPHFLAFVQGVQELNVKRTAVVANRYYPQ